MKPVYRYSPILKYSNQFVGHPKIAARGRDRAVVCDWTGTIALNDLDSKKKPIVRSANVAVMYGGQPVACQNLSSLQVQPEKQRACAVATKGAYAAVWDFKSGEVYKIEPIAGPVNAVAYSPDGTRLAIGTGRYALASGQVVRPTVEVWKFTKSGPTRLKATTLPGVCVDAMLWDADSDRIVCVTGEATQDSGWLCCLDGTSLLAHCLDRIPFAVSTRILDVGQSYLVAHRAGIQSYDRDSFRPGWAHAEDVETATLAFDEETDTLFFGGATFLTGDGDVLGKAESPATCSWIAARPGGGFLSVSDEGMIGLWDFVAANG